MKYTFLFIGVVMLFASQTQSIAQQQRSSLQTTPSQPFFFNKDADWKTGNTSTATVDSNTNWGIENWGPIMHFNDSGDLINSSVWIANGYTHFTYTPWGRLFYARSSDGVNFKTRELFDRRFSGIAVAYLAVTEQCVMIYYWVFMNGFGHSPIYLIRSFDNGDTFDSARAITQESFDAFPDCYPAVWNDTVVITLTYFNRKKMPTGAYFYTSYDNGSTWKKTIARLPITEMERQIALTPGKLHLLYTKRRNSNKKFRGGETMYLSSTDGGNIWKNKNSNRTALTKLDGYTSSSARIASSYKEHLYVSWMDGQLGSTTWGLTGSVFFRKSTNAGKTWTPEVALTQRPDAGTSSLAVERNEGKNVAVAWDKMVRIFDTTQTIVRISMDGGTLWYPEVNVNPNSFLGVGPSVAVGTDRVTVVWSEVSPVSSPTHPFLRSAALPQRKPSPLLPPQNIVSPSTTQLVGNYPNPFNPVTVIRYTLSARSTVTLKVYNTLGQEIAALLLNKEQKEGVYEETFDASNLASGMYFAHLTVETLWGDNHREVKKLVVAK